VGGDAMIHEVLEDGRGNGVVGNAFSGDDILLDAVAGGDAVGGLNLVDEGVAGGEDVIGFSGMD